MTDLEITMGKDENQLQPWSASQLTDSGKNDLSEALNRDETIKSIQFFFGIWMDTLVEKTKAELQQTDCSSLKDARIISCNLRENDGDKYIDCKWINIALEEYRKNPGKPMILTSFLPLNSEHWNWIVGKNKLDMLLGKPNVKYIQLPFNTGELPKLFMHSEKQNINTSEEAFQNILEKEISSFLHDAKNWISDTSIKEQSYESQLEYLLSQPDDIKSEKWIAFEDKLISLLQFQHPSYKSVSRERNLGWIIETFKYIKAKELPEWTRYAWVFVDRDGTLYDNEKHAFNQHVLDLIKKYQQEGKKITIFTLGNIKIKQALLDASNINLKVESKIDYKWATVEIVIDDENEEKLYMNAKIKAENHIKI